MGIFLEICSLPKLNQEEPENLNRLIITNVIEAVMKKLSTNESPGLADFTGEFYQTFREEITHILITLFQKFQEKTSKISYEASIILIPKPDKDTTKNENCRPISLMNIDAKILKKILAIWIQQYIKKIIYHDQVGFITQTLEMVVGFLLLLILSVASTFQLFLPLCNQLLESNPLYLEESCFSYGILMDREGYLT